MQFNENSLIAIFIEVDDFCQAFEKWERQKFTISSQNWKSRLSQSEALSILIFYHHSGYKCFEYYYDRMVFSNLRSYFPTVVTHKHFLSLIPKCFELMYLFAQWKSAQSQRNGIYYVDSKRLPVCHNKRIKRNKVFKNIAQSGKSSMGWFYGLKIHLVINNFGEIVSFLLTSANFSDNNKNVLHTLLDGLQGHCYGDKGYLSKLFEHFYLSGLKIVTKVRKNMKNKLLPLQEKYHLMRRGIIESVNDILMTVCDIEHTRHRSPQNAMVHIIGAIAAYAFLENKPTVIMKNLIA